MNTRTVPPVRLTASTSDPSARYLFLCFLQDTSKPNFMYFCVLHQLTRAHKTQVSYTSAESNISNIIHKKSWKCIVQAFFNENSYYSISAIARGGISGLYTSEEKETTTGRADLHRSQSGASSYWSLSIATEELWVRGGGGDRQSVKSRLSQLSTFDLLTSVSLRQQVSDVADVDTSTSASPALFFRLRSLAITSDRAEEVASTHSSGPQIEVGRPESVNQQEEITCAVMKQCKTDRAGKWL